jgi:hypothetical protein
MSARQIRVDLSLLRQGASVAFEFGRAALEELARVGELVEHAVYERRSLSERGGQVSFTLLNPPLRMGAFREIRLFWNGTRLSPASVHLRSGDGPERSLASIDADHPATPEVGQRHRFRFEVPNRAAGVQRIRIELVSSAIPPLVWFEFGDLLRTGGDAP